MIAGFWEQLDTPIFALAPMEDVTDVAFRTLFAKYSPPETVLWTEFTSADALAHDFGRTRVDHRLRFDREKESPIVAQIFGSNPENIEIATRLCVERGFDGVDLNMGCPVKKIESAGSCSGLIRTPDIAKETIEAAKRGAKRLGGLDAPVSVKTRIGYNEIDLPGWIGFLLKLDLPVLTVHLRTKKEMSDVPAHWELMSEIVQMRDALAPKTLIIGNGDIQSMEEARVKMSETGCDGIMVGRGAFGNPWFFDECYTPTMQDKLRVLVEHTHLFEKEFLTQPESRNNHSKDTAEGWHRMKNFAIMKKHFKAYANGFDGAAGLRANLMKADNALQVEEVVAHFLRSLKENS